MVKLSHGKTRQINTTVIKFDVSNVPDSFRSFIFFFLKIISFYVIEICVSSFSFFHCMAISPKNPNKEVLADKWKSIFKTEVIGQIAYPRAIDSADGAISAAFTY